MQRPQDFIAALPPSVRGLVWVLAAIHFRIGAGGASYMRLRELMGHDNAASQRKLIDRAVQCKAVVRRRNFAGRPAVALRKDCLKKLEAFWS